MSARMMRHVLFVYFFALLPIRLLQAQTVPAGPGSNHRATPGPAKSLPVIRVAETTPSGVTVEVEGLYTGALILNNELAGTPVSDAVILQATGGLYSTSELVVLPQAIDPIVTITNSDFQESRLDWLNVKQADSLAAALPAAPLRVVGTGVSAGRAVTSLEANLLTFNPDERLLRRYTRISAGLRFRSVGAVSKAAKSASNPHLLVENSVLATGTWFKIMVEEEGVYRIDPDYVNSLGISPGNVDPSRLRVFGNGGQPLPTINGAPRPADLVENAVLVVDDGDASFESGEYLLFYAAGPYGWRFDEAESDWRHYVHPYSVKNAYFLQIGGETGKRVAESGFPGYTDAVASSTYEERLFVDDDRFILEQDGSGSGLEWFGDLVDDEVPNRTIVDHETGLAVSGTVRYRTRVAVQSNPAATVRFLSGSTELGSATPGAVSLGAGTNELGHIARASITEFSEPMPQSGRIKLDMRLDGRGNDPKGWLDWAEVFYPRALDPENGVLRFSTPAGVTGRFEYQLSGFGTVPEVWDVTSADAIQKLSVEMTGGIARVQLQVADERAPRELVAFTNEATAIRAPEPGESVTAQDLHGSTDYPELIIVTPAEFRAVVDEFAQYRRADGLTVSIAEVEQIYNEFSGGVPDVRAIRDYFRFLYDRGIEEGRPFKYALLFGDGHFDFRGITEDPGSPLNPNWIFPYQTEETLLRGQSYTSDDYFGLLDADEGEWIWTGDAGGTHERVDIGIGRIPVETVEEAQIVLEKIKMYEQTATQGAWRTRYTFVADDGLAGSGDDKDLHTQNADVVAEAVEGLFPEINIEKIYAISYPVVTTANGRRIPDAKRDIIDALDEGTLVWNYSGHGGLTGLADERIFTLEDVDELQNDDRLSLFITATCTFGRFDTDREKSGAEKLLVKPVGGSVALFSTVRVVVTWVNPQTFNLGLNLELNKHLFRRDEEGRALRLGDVLRLTKNSSVGLQGNNRKFNLLGDPTMRIALPRREVEIIDINGAPLEQSVPLRALERVRMNGTVSAPGGGTDPTYNGTVEVTVFDAARDVQIEEDKRRHIPSGSYKVQNDLIYRGVVEVRDGRFTSEFVVPKDISYSNERGRISMYATSEGGDGFGATEQITVGGTAENPVQDNEGPALRLFLNDTTFVSGGLTTSSPTLIVKLADESGINTVGTGVGHELLLIVDEDEQEAIEIGDRFEGDLGSFQRGSIRVRLPEQSAGTHTLAVRAWDVINNSTTESIEFTVTSTEALRVRNVYNYPNPTLGGETRFFFEHNQSLGVPAELEIRIYSISGRLIRRIESFEALPNGVLDTGLAQIVWDGRDDDGDRLATGVYLYKIKVVVERESARDVVEHIGKLAVIN